MTQAGTSAKRSKTLLYHNEWEEDFFFVMVKEKCVCLTCNSKITSKADVSCTPIGPPLLKARPSLQTQVSNTTNIRVPDRGLKAAGAA
ncbi:hypothetical protein TNCV_5124941 [Trichonephila clavipes]|nr:hypothetical protein TNCV_5124941 [Trichonephila clavipes]